MRVPRLLVVGGDPSLYDLVTAAAVHLQLLVQHTDVREAATEAARLRPMALVIPDDVYEFDRTGFDELARDVGARLYITLTERPDVRRLAEELIMLMAELELPS
jgi:hypothetical protein